MFNFFVKNATSLKAPGYIAIIVVIAALILAIGFISKGREKQRMQTKQLVFSSLAIAMAMVTSMLKLFHLPMGGSVTLFSMFFICLIGYWYGLRIGLMTGLAYGLLQLMIDPYIISFQQMVVDYLLAFGALGLSGIFHNSRHGMIKGYVAGVLGRLLFAFLSGMIFFGLYAKDYGMSAPIYSLAYNGSYIGAEAALTLVVICMPPVTKALAEIKKIAGCNSAPAGKVQNS